MRSQPITELSAGYNTTLAVLLPLSLITVVDEKERGLHTFSICASSLIDYLTSTNLSMAAYQMPRWVQIVNEKRDAREHAIHSFLDSSKARFEVFSAPLYQPHAPG